MSIEVVMFDKWTQEDIEKLAHQCDLPSVPQTTRQSCWSDDWDHGGAAALFESGSVLPNDLKVTQLSGRMI